MTYEIRVGLEPNCDEPECGGHHHIAVVMVWDKQWSNAGICEHGKTAEEAFSLALKKYKEHTIIDSISTFLFTNFDIKLKK